MKTAGEALERLASMTTIGNAVGWTDKHTGEGRSGGVVEDEVSVMTDDNESKHFHQRIRQADGTYTRRSCYYTLDKSGTRIVFGQYAPWISEADYCELLAKERAKGWPI